MRIRKRFFFEGMVQGVGFRPFLWRQANARGLAGFVRNRPDGVVAEVEGDATAVEAFLAGVEERLPPLAEITRITRTELPLAGGGEGRFVIVASDSERAKQTASAIAESIGFSVVDAGGLKNARYLEPLAGLNIYLAYGAGQGTGIAPTWIRKA